MIAPTQAQVEAALKNAADAFGDYQYLGPLSANRHRDECLKALAAITAAAQVTQEDIEGAKAIIDKADQTVNRLNFLATIERCAQVVEGFHNGHSLFVNHAKDIAAAVRKLKHE